jgi:redox-sensing transcriptional repressor
MKKASEKNIERLLKYMEFAKEKINADGHFIFSHELASAVGVSPEQVRRDLMSLDISGIPQKGYPLKEFLTEITSHLKCDKVTQVVLVGLGHLGKAILSHFMKIRPQLSIVATFDIDPEKTKRVYSGCMIFHTNSMPKVIKSKKATVAIITVPAEHAQETADLLIKAGIKGIINFAPVKLNVPENVFVEQVDITLSIEKTAYFAEDSNKEK